MANLVFKFNWDHRPYPLNSAQGKRQFMLPFASGIPNLAPNFSQVQGTASISQGGTGAATAENARTSLGAAASGANNDITELKALAQPWSLNQGGTGANNAAAARANLGLPVSSSFSSVTAPKNLGCVAAYNVSANNTPYDTFLNTMAELGVPAIGSVNLVANSDGSVPPSTGWTTYISVRHRGGVGDGNGYGFLILDRGMQGTVPQLYVQKQSQTSWGNPVKLYHTANTTTDANGFIKAASPIVKLFADKIELNDEATEQAITFEKLEVGHYLIKGSSGFASEGWYIEQPKDSNGNLYHVVEFDTLESGDIEIRTYDYILDKKGRIVADHDTPLDIQQGRWIDIRLQELPQPVIDELDFLEPFDSESTAPPDFQLTNLSEAVAAALAGVEPPQISDETE